MSSGEDRYRSKLSMLMTYNVSPCVIQGEESGGICRRITERLRDTIGRRGPCAVRESEGRHRRVRCARYERRGRCGSSGGRGARLWRAHGTFRSLLFTHASNYGRRLITATLSSPELQSVIKATSAKPKKEKKKAKKQAFDDEDAANGDEDAEQKSKAPVEMTAEELADEEWGLPDKKGKKKKDKKGKKGKGPAADDDVDEILSTFILALTCIVSRTFADVIAMGRPGDSGRVSGRRGEHGKGADRDDGGGARRRGVGSHRKEGKEEGKGKEG